MAGETQQVKGVQCGCARLLLRLVLLWVTTAVAQTTFSTGPTADTLPPALKSCGEQMISVFENESTSLKYDYVETCMTVAGSLRRATDLRPGTAIFCKWSKFMMICGPTMC